MAKLMTIPAFLLWSAPLSLASPPVCPALFAYLDCPVDPHCSGPETGHCLFNLKDCECYSGMKNGTKEESLATVANSPSCPAMSAYVDCPVDPKCSGPEPGHCIFDLKDCECYSGLKDTVTEAARSEVQYASGDCDCHCCERSHNADTRHCCGSSNCDASCGAMNCPGSASFLMRAKTQVVAKAAAHCADVRKEIEARVAGQKGWVDPHNGGVYSLLPGQVTADGNVQIWTNRTTNPKKAVGHRAYTDKQVFTLVEEGGKCSIYACSESQGISYKDFSTNYCDIRDLYCGSADGCVTVLNDFMSTELSVKASSGQSDFAVCTAKTVVV